MKTSQEDEQGPVHRLARVKTAIQEAAARAGRSPDTVRLVVVSKGRALSHVRELVDLGVRDLGENRPREMVSRWRQLDEPGVVWHFMGRLQRNAVRRVLRACDWLHSLDRWPLAEALEQRGEALDAPLPTLVQVNVTGEARKAGLAPAEVNDFLTAAAQLQHIAIRGLMTMAPHVGDAEEVRPLFRQLRLLARRLQPGLPPGVQLGELSMGMTNDYPVAVEEGATMVRVGRAVFTDVEPA